MNLTPSWELDTAQGANFNWSCDQHATSEKPTSTNHAINTTANSADRGATCSRNARTEFEVLINNYNDGVSKDNASSIFDAADTSLLIQFPLATRGLPPHCHTIATWNVNNGFTVEAVSTIIHKFNVSILFVQEPLLKFSASYASYLCNRLQGLGIGAFLQPKQFLLYCEDHIDRIEYPR